jgi:type IV pilus assembly protein PilM
MGLFSISKDNLFLGIDIGDSSLKMVELKKKGRKISLSNYAFSENIMDVNFTKVEDLAYLSQVILKVRKEAGITATKVTASLPNFAVFSSIINLTNVDKKNILTAVNEEARKVIPLPLEEMVLDWKIIPGPDGKIPTRGNMRVFLTGSPKKLVRKYVEVFKKTGLNLVSLETETFSLVRSLVGSDKEAVMVVEIGANSTDMFVIKESIPVFNRSLSVSSSTITKALAEQLGLEYSQAEQFKIDLANAADKQGGAAELSPLIAKTIEPIVTGIQYLLDFFRSQTKEEVNKIILSGGGAMLLNLPEYLSERLNLKVIIGDAWNRVEYPEELRPVLQEVGAKLSVAIGLAMREIE